VEKVSYKQLCCKTMFIDSHLTGTFLNAPRQKQIIAVWYYKTEEQTKMTIERRKWQHYRLVHETWATLCNKKQMEPDIKEKSDSYGCWTRVKNDENEKWHIL